MADRNGNTKITKYRRHSSFLNIGTLIFGAIFVYMVFCLIIYFTAEHVTSYEVTAGSISGNYRYTALALKTEEVIQAPQSGKVTYYAREGAKASSGMTICSINENGSDVSAASDLTLTSGELSQLSNTMASFTRSFDDSSYQSVYNFKADLESYILQLSQTEDGSAVSLLNQCNAPESGFVVYAVDGMEQLSESGITSELFNQNSYQKSSLRLNVSVKAGDDLYKLVTSESWALYFPLDSTLATELEDRKSIRFRFLKDNNTFTAGFSILKNDGEYFGKILLNNSLIRYVSDRYLEIELLMDRKSGLKIPSSAIAEKVFYRIPEDYVITNNDTENEITLLRETFNKDGSSSVKYVTATVYSKEDGYYLINTDLFKNGDYVQMVDTSKKFQIQENNTETIQGVYNINKGYAVFREVTVVDENEEFCIVEPNNIYGLAAHDHIVLDADTVNADDIVY
ncbi:MAG: HlyD family efflux transporter periplasmic adaptor subunit [Lachnospiraceae bacterium]|nr:HlyD family efflux transporter periplasmic adaptor subunit [Lachnospiraceae bacterium]